MNENRKKLNGRSSRQSRERTELMEKFLKDLEEFLSRDYMLNVVADRISEEYAAAPDDYEPTDEDLEEQAKEEAEFRRDIIRERKYNVFRKYLQQGIELKKDDPDSELFKTAKQLLELLDQAESDISSISRRQLRKYKTDFSIYTQLLDSELTKQIVLKKPAETEQENKDAKREREGMIQPKPPEIFQKILWIQKYGRKHWKLVSLAILIVLCIWILSKINLFS